MSSSSAGTDGTRVTAGPEIYFPRNGGSVAWVTREGGRATVFHNGRAGNPYQDVASLVLSVDGQRYAYLARIGARWRVVVDGKEGQEYDEVASLAFSPDGAHLAYRGRWGGAWRLVVDGKAAPGEPTTYGMHAFSGDSKAIVFVDGVDGQGIGRLVLADLGFEKLAVIEPRVSNVQLDGARARVAAVAEVEGRQLVLTLALDRPDQITRFPPQDAILNLAFLQDGSAVGYVAERGGKTIIAVGDREAPLAPGDNVISPPIGTSGSAETTAIVISESKVFLRRFLPAPGPGDGGYAGIEDVVYSRDGRSHAYAAEKDGRWHVVVNGLEGPGYDRVVSPDFSPDGRALVYRARQGGKRFVVVADLTGKTLKQHPAYEAVFPVQFTSDGKSVAYGVKDGRQLAWKVEPL